MGSTRIIPYQPGLFDLLTSAGEAKFPAVSRLRQKAFLDWYYASSDFGQLALLVNGQDQCLACLGRETMSFHMGGSARKIACLSSFYSFHEGLGFYLFAAVLREAEAGLILGATEQGIRFARGLKWNFDEIPAYCLNRVYWTNGDHPLKTLGKIAWNATARKTRLAGLAEKLRGELQAIQVVEETKFPSSLLNFRSAFPFRWTPSLDHLQWRYAMNLPFVRYRLFRAFVGARYIGYAILQDLPTGILVSQVDGSDPELLAGAVIHAVGMVAQSESDTREVMLLSSHPSMQAVFKSIGFVHTPRRDKFFTLGSMRGPVTNPVGAADWLMNFDLGDRGLASGPAAVGSH